MENEDDTMDLIDYVDTLMLLSLAWPDIKQEEDVNHE